MKVESDYAQGPALTQGSSKGFTPLSRQNSGLFTREEQAMARNPHARRLPQRSRTTHEHIPLGPQILTVMRPQPQQHTSTSLVPTQNTVGAGAISKQAKTQIASASPVDPQNESTDSVTPLESSKPSQPRRPKLGGPRRSYSVTDYEPVPPEQRPASGSLTLSTMPSELHYAVFDFLDPIDAACLGLTNSHFYAIHRRMHGSVPLSVRRDGPNELEWAWHLASRPIAGHSGSTGASNAATTTNTMGAGDKANLAAMRVRGKGLCRKCGVSRCELHKHIREWVPETHEYCSVRDKFVPRPGEDARAHCYMSNPRNTARCGRHRVKKQ
ncbi:hypothetical protein diail_2432 [Diaporthe ilicicola]|nr:hypothetical protein diail_2432 [Diaporthe ilicicola]